MDIIIRRKFWTVVIKQTEERYRAFTRTLGKKQDCDLEIDGDSASDVPKSALSFINEIHIMEPI